MSKIAESEAPRALRRAAKPVVVLDLGDAPLAGPDAVVRAAEEVVFEIECGNAVVAVLPPYRDAATDLASLARTVSASPHPRELDLLVSSAALMATALCAMAVHRLGHSAVALEGTQAGIITDGVHTRATVVGVDVGRIERELRRNDAVLVSGALGTARASQELTVLAIPTETLVDALGEALHATIRTRDADAPKNW